MWNFCLRTDSVFRDKKAEYFSLKCDSICGVKVVWFQIKMDVQACHVSYPMFRLWLIGWVFWLLMYLNIVSFSYSLNYRSNLFQWSCNIWIMSQHQFPLLLPVLVDWSGVWLQRLRLFVQHQFEWALNRTCMAATTDKFCIRPSMMQLQH